MGELGGRWGGVLGDEGAEGGEEGGAVAVGDGLALEAIEQGEQGVVSGGSFAIGDFRLNHQGAKRFDRLTDLSVAEGAAEA